MLHTASFLTCWFLRRGENQVDRNRKFSMGIFPAPAIFKATSKHVLPSTFHSVCRLQVNFLGVCRPQVFFLGVRCLPSFMVCVTFKLIFLAYVTFYISRHESPSSSHGVYCLQVLLACVVPWFTWRLSSSISFSRRDKFVVTV